MATKPPTSQSTTIVVDQILFLILIIWTIIQKCTMIPDGKTIEKKTRYKRYDNHYHVRLPQPTLTSLGLPTINVSKAGDPQRRGTSENQDRRQQKGGKPGANPGTNRRTSKKMGVKSKENHGENLEKWDLNGFKTLGKTLGKTWRTWRKPLRTNVAFRFSEFPGNAHPLSQRSGNESIKI